MTIAKRWGCLLLAMLLTISLVSCANYVETDWNDPVQGSSGNSSTSTSESAPVDPTEDATTGSEESNTEDTTESSVDGTTESTGGEEGSSTSLESNSTTATDTTTGKTSKTNKTSKTQRPVSSGTGNQPSVSVSNPIPENTTGEDTVSTTQNSTTESQATQSVPSINIPLNTLPITIPGTTTTTVETTTTKETTTTTTTTKKTTTTTTTTTKFVPKQKNILIIGNSHSIDAVWLLYQAYQDQYPGTDLCVGILYYSGGSVREHAEITETGEKTMLYYKNTTGKWKITKNHGTKDVLQDRPWDTIMFQPGKEDLNSGDMNLKYRRQLEAFVDKYVTNPHDFVWHVSWPNPNDELFYSPDYVRQPPKNYRKNLEKLYGFNPVTQFNVMQSETRNNILGDSTYAYKVCTGTAIMHAYLSQGVPQVELWRDYTHVNDYGRLIVAYAMLTQLTGKPIESVGVNKIAASMRHDMYKSQGDLKITKNMKNVLIKAVNYTLKNPWTMPPQN